MMLYQLFSWLNGSSLDVSSIDLLIERTAVETELQQAHHRQRELRGELHAARFEKSEVSSAACASRVAEHEAYLQFLMRCQTLLEGRASAFIAFNLLLLDTYFPFHEEKIKALFDKLWNVNKEQALSVYETHRAKLSHHPLVSLKVSADVMNHHLETFSRQGQYQEEPLAVIPLLDVFYEDVEQFAGAMLWLLKRGITEQALLQTHVLHQFMAYHLAWLGAPKNPLSQMMALLATSPLADGLIATAARVRCEERGFHAYALTGILNPERRLENVPFKPLPNRWTLTEDNFKALVGLFGFPFVLLAFMHHTDHPSEPWQACFHQMFNQSEGFDLPAFINQVASFRKMSALQTLSSLILEETLVQLLKRHRGAVLHLVAYRPAVLTHMKESDIKAFIKHLGLVHEQAFDVMAQLLALFHVTRNGNQALAATVVEAMLDVALAHPDFFEDRALIKQLRRWFGIEAILAHRVQALQAQFEHCLAGYVREDVMQLERFHLIEDSWSQWSRQVVLLEAIMPLDSFHPDDKFKLAAVVAKAYGSSHPGPFRLDEFINSIGITPTWLFDGVGEYERVLVELITTFDDEHLRQTIIKRFEALGARKHRWMDEPYGGESVFHRATVRGNVGLVRWLDAHGRVDEAEIQDALSAGACQNQWAVMDYFCTTSLHRLNQSYLKHFLVLAAEAGQLGTVTLLCGGVVHHLQEKHIEPAFLKAAAKNHAHIVSYLCHLDNVVLSDTVLAKGMKVAIQFHCFETIDFLGHLPRKKTLLNLVERTLVHAATRDDLSMVQILCQLRNYTPTRSVLLDTLLKATQFGHAPIVQFLCGLEGCAPSQKIIDEALILAVAHGYLPIARHLCELTSTGPSQVALERGLLRAVQLKRVDFIPVLSSIARVPVRQRTFNQALEIAVKIGDIPLIACLSPFATSHALKQTFEWAAKHGQAEVATYCSSMLDRTTVRAPLPHIEVPKKSFFTCVRVSPYVLTARETKLTLDAVSLRKTASCGALSKVGFFRVGCPLERIEPHSPAPS